LKQRKGDKTPPDCHVIDDPTVIDVYSSVSLFTRDPPCLSKTRKIDADSALGICCVFRHLYYIIPPILLLGYLYKPLFGRRDAIKVGWLMFMVSMLANRLWGYSRPHPGRHIGDHQAEKSSSWAFLIVGDMLDHSMGQRTSIHLSPVHVQNQTHQT